MQPLEFGLYLRYMDRRESSCRRRAPAIPRAAVPRLAVFRPRVSHSEMGYSLSLSTSHTISPQSHSSGEKVERTWRKDGENVDKRCREHVKRRRRKCGEIVERLWRDCGEHYFKQINLRRAPVRFQISHCRL